MRDSFQGEAVPFLSLCSANGLLTRMQPQSRPRTNLKRSAFPLPAEGRTSEWRSHSEWWLAKQLNNLRWNPPGTSRGQINPNPQRLSGSNQGVLIGV